MNSKDRNKLKKFALEQLNATADDEERWSFAWGRDGSANFSYCDWSKFAEEEFDSALGLDLPWTKERRDEIERGDADPNEEELRQWREAKCRQAAADGEAWIVWIVPVTMDKLTAYAAFHWDYGGAPEDPPILDGIFENLDEAKAAYVADGFVDGWHLS